MPKSAHEKQLARVAARREAEKRAARQRKRQTRAWIVLAVVAVIVVAAAAIVWPSSKSTEANADKSFCDFTKPPGIAPKAQLAKAPKMTIDRRATYLATLDTSCGKIVVNLDPARAPVAVNNFVALSKEGWYDGTLFHRISNSIDIIQGGDALCVDDPATCGSGTPGYSFDDELTGKEVYDPGVVAMANSGPNTNGSQFFIVTGPQGRNLGPSYTIFGRVADPQSLAVAQRIQGLPVQGETPKDQVWLRSVSVSEGGTGGQS